MFCIWDYFFFWSKSPDTTLQYLIKCNEGLLHSYRDQSTAFRANQLNGLFMIKKGLRNSFAAIKSSSETFEQPHLSEDIFSEQKGQIHW